MATTKNILSYFFRRINVQTRVVKSPRRKAARPRSAPKPRLILWTIQGKTQDQARILEVR